MMQHSSSSDHEVAEKCKSDVKEEEEEEEEEKQQEHFHVLAVDDSLVDRKLLERLLSISSYQVTCVDSGDKALEYLGLIDDHIHQEEEEEEAANEDDSAEISDLMKSDSPCPFSSNKSSNQQKQVSKVNLIITDYSMPGITGYDLLMKLKESSWKDIPVIVVSSEDVPSRISMCLEGGAQEFLLKPVKLSDLSKIHSHLLNSNCNYTNIDAFEIDADDDKDINCTNNNPNKRKAAKTLPSAISEIMPRAKELSVS